MFKFAGRAVANAIKVGGGGSTTPAQSAVDKLLPIPLDGEAVIFEDHFAYVEDGVARLFPNSSFIKQQDGKENFTVEDCDRIRARVKDSIIQKEGQQQVIDFLHRIRKRIVMDKGKDWACNLEDIVEFSEKLWDMQKKVARELRREAERQAIKEANEKGKASGSSSNNSPTHRMSEVRNMSQAQLLVCSNSRPVKAAALLTVCGAQSKNFGRLKPNPSDIAKTHFTWAADDFASIADQPTVAMLAPSLSNREVVHHANPKTVDHREVARSAFTKLSLPGRVHDELGVDDVLDVALATARGVCIDKDRQLTHDPIENSFGGKFVGTSQNSMDPMSGLKRTWNLSQVGGTIIGNKQTWNRGGSCALEADAPMKISFMAAWPAA